jgi:hypothetical protein
MPLNWNDGSEDYNIIADLRKENARLQAEVARLTQEQEKK